MARIWQCGFELNSVTTGVEWTLLNDAPTVVTSPARSGTYAGRASSLGSGNAKGFLHQFLSVAADGPYFFGFAFQYATLPTAANVIWAIQGGTTFANIQAADLAIKLNTDGSLALFNNTQVGSNSAVLAANTWYYIEVKYDRTPAAASEVAEAKIDGSVFATSSALTLNRAVRTLMVGGNLFFEAQTTGDWFIDDVKINDSTGAAQTGYPDSGKIIHLKPDSAGDANGFAVQVGGTAGSSNNFTRVNEVTPDDATSYNGSAILSSEDLLNCEASGLASIDTVNVVAVGVRMADLVGADATAAFKLEIEKTAAGTKTQSGALIPNSTSFLTNAAAIPRNYPLVTYLDPDGAAWTNSTLNSMQIGYTQTATNVQTIAVSTVWASVDYTPGVAPTVSIARRRMLTGVGR